MSRKDEGLRQLTLALESGERLYPSTANEGREVIRQDLRALRDTWENFNDNLNDAQRRLESSRMQWSSFDENFDELRNWMAEMSSQMESDGELRNTLGEKKATLQKCRVCLIDSLQHVRNPLRVLLYLLSLEFFHC